MTLGACDQSLVVTPVSSSGLGPGGGVVEVEAAGTVEGFFGSADGVSAGVGLTPFVGWPGGIAPPGSHRSVYVEFHITGCMSHGRLC
jgi:hypothetical protein